jgi:hypothetical protein
MHRPVLNEPSRRQMLGDEIPLAGGRYVLPLHGKLIAICSALLRDVR